MRSARRRTGPAGQSAAGTEQPAGGGYCVRLLNRPAGRRRLKPLHSVLDQRSLLAPAMLRLTRWIADYYLCDWATVLDAVVRPACAAAPARDDHAAVGGF